jgi:non-specific serine/threonine protein kinase
VLRRALSAADAREANGRRGEDGAATRYRAGALVQEAVLASVLGEHAEAVALGEMALALGRELADSVLMIRALVVVTVARISTDEPASARPYLRECARLGQDMDDPLSRAVILHNLAWCHLQIDDVDEAAALLNAALPLYRERADAHRHGAALHTLGALALVRGDLAGAQTHFAEALALVSPLSTSFCLEGQAMVETRRGRHEQALRLFDTASHLRQTHQTEPDAWWRRQIDQAHAYSRTAVDRTLPPAVLPRAGPPAIDAGSPATRDPNAGDTLTARERDIADLVAEGMTNRQIAGRLGVSVRTVDTHLEHIRRKLAVASRTQVAIWASRQGADPADPAGF